MSDEKQLTAISTRDIAGNIATSFKRVATSTRTYRQSDDLSVKQKQLRVIERELDATHYWFTLLQSDGGDNGIIGKHVLSNMSALIDVTQSAVQLLHKRNKTHG